jgi:hypothetical protein
LDQKNLVEDGNLTVFIIRYRFFLMTPMPFWTFLCVSDATGHLVKEVGLTQKRCVVLGPERAGPRKARPGGQVYLQPTRTRPAI